MALDAQKENKSYEEAYGTLKSAIRPDITNTEVMEIYDKWSSQYDQDTSTLGYNPPVMLVREVDTFFGNNKDINILDLASGTGKVGKALYEKGFKKIDAIDGSSGMMEVVKKLNIYTNCYHAIVGSNKLDIPEDTYDLIATSGSFCPGHLSEECFEELIRITKKGGHIMILMSRSYFTRKEEFALNMESRMFQLEEKGVWKVLSKEVKEHYYKDLEGVLFLLQKR